MTNLEIQEKYGIELINKEMWVWDEDISLACRCFVVEKVIDRDRGYYGYAENRSCSSYINASETDPRIKQEPCIGDKGYFWDKEDYIYVYAKIHHIDKEQEDPYVSDIPGLMPFKYFSLTKQTWMK